ncbi:MAG: class I SAM-dependent DNA methyltransferase, partial [Candidatus Heimdallarchaeota archaeon]
MTKADKYETLAKYYDKVYELKDYKGESKILEQLIKQYKKSAGKELLDVACGTGTHLNFLKETFTCMGTDLNAGMIDVAKNKHPEIHFEVADMAELNLNKKFDVITCLFSSIGYITTKERLSKTIKGFSDHLKPGGVMFIEQWLDKAIFRAGEPHIATYKN